jgi:hypothetical protein
MYFNNFIYLKDDDIILKTHVWVEENKLIYYCFYRDYVCIKCNLMAKDLDRNMYEVEYLSCDEKIIKDIIE